MRNAGPLLATIAWAWASWLVLWVLYMLFGVSTALSGLLWSLVAFFAGYFYTQLYEYWYHRFPMHRNAQGKGIWFRIHDCIRKAHIEHHRAFPRSRFTVTADELSKDHPKKDGTQEPLKEMVVMRWSVYPVLFGIHWFILTLVSLPSGFVVLFLLGTVVHYNFFEISHWYTHVQPNRLNEFLLRLPVIGAIRRENIELHRIHHAEEGADFNFTPPYLGDLLGKTLKLPE